MKNEFDWHIQINKMQNLNDMAIWSKTYDRFEVRDAIVAHKAKLFKEREEFQK